MSFSRDRMDKIAIANIINSDFPEPGPITRETVDRTIDLSHRFRGSTRMAIGRIVTDREHEARRRKALETALP